MLVQGKAAEVTRDAGQTIKTTKDIANNPVGAATDALSAAGIDLGGFGLV